MGRMVVTEENWSTETKTCPSAALPITSATQTVTAQKWLSFLTKNLEYVIFSNIRVLSRPRRVAEHELRNLHKLPLEEATE